MGTNPDAVTNQNCCCEDAVLLQKDKCLNNPGTNCLIDHRRVCVGRTGCAPCSWPCQISKGGTIGRIGLNPSDWPVQWSKKTSLGLGWDMRCNSYIHILMENVSMLKTTQGCGHPGRCSWLSHGVLNKSLVCHMLHWSDGQRGAATQPKRLWNQPLHAYAVDYHIVARKGQVHFYSDINMFEMFRENQQSRLGLGSKDERH